MGAAPGFQPISMPPSSHPSSLQQDTSLSKVPVSPSLAFSPQSTHLPRGVLAPTACIGLCLLPALQTSSCRSLPGCGLRVGLQPQQRQRTAPASWQLRAVWLEARRLPGGYWPFKLASSICRGSANVAATFPRCSRGQS